MAVKKSTTSTKAARIAASEKQAKRIIGSVYGPLYALQDFGIRASEMRCEFNSLFLAVSGLCDKGIATCADVMNALPREHPARAHIVKASAALDALKRFMEMSECHSEADSSRPARSFLAVVSRGMVPLIAECGRYCERAEFALGRDSVETGFLEGHLLDNEDMVRVTDDERVILHRLRHLDEKQRIQISAVAAELLKQQKHAAA